MSFFGSSLQTFYVIQGDQLFIIRLVNEDLFKGGFKYVSKTEGQFKGRGVVPLLDGYYSLPGYMYKVGQLLLGHFARIKSKSTDIILYVAFWHLRLPSCNNRSESHCP